MEVRKRQHLLHFSNTAGLHPHTHTGTSSAQIVKLKLKENSLLRLFICPQTAQVWLNEEFVVSLLCFCASVSLCVLLCFETVCLALVPLKLHRKWFIVLRELLSFYPPQSSTLLCFLLFSLFAFPSDATVSHDLIVASFHLSRLMFMPLLPSI